jgi:hypothetical protein
VFLVEDVPARIVKQEGFTNRRHLDVELLGVEPLWLAVASNVSSRELLRFAEDRAQLARIGRRDLAGSEQRRRAIAASSESSFASAIPRRRDSNAWRVIAVSSSLPTMDPEDDGAVASASECDVGARTPELSIIDQLALPGVEDIELDLPRLDRLVDTAWADD